MNRFVLGFYYFDYALQQKTLIFTLILKIKKKLNRYQEVLDSYGSQLQNNNNKAFKLLKKNRLEEALEYYDQAIQHSEENSIYYNNKVIFQYIVVSKVLNVSKNYFEKVMSTKRFQESLKCQNLLNQINPKNDNFSQQGNLDDVRRILLQRNIKYPKFMSYYFIFQRNFYKEYLK
ncbi:unnamed protein product [Paramecium octaurelia]|uniref:Tetratricopeptide repeat protein n=1 Tax=Paramecium octaurelia TaxID=43137 RepID=A0A8S1T5G1_PAROT|nr:unnamed protein product [Paramecium octaurelia]